MKDYNKILKNKISNIVEIAGAVPNDIVNIVDGGKIAVATRFFNELYDPKLSEARLRNSLEYCDYVEKEGNYSDLDPYKSGVLTLIENPDIPPTITPDDFTGFKRHSYKVEKRLGLFRIGGEHLDTQNLDELVVAISKARIVKTENKAIVDKLNSILAERNEQPFLLAGIDNIKVLDTIKANFGVETILNGSIIGNYAFYQKIATEKNIETGVLKVVDGVLYYLNMPLLLISNESSGTVEPVAFIGVLDNVLKFIEDSKTPYEIATLIALSGYKDEFQGRVISWFGLGEKSGKFIKIGETK